MRRVPRSQLRPSQSITRGSVFQVGILLGILVVCLTTGCKPNPSSKPPSNSKPTIELAKSATFVKREDSTFDNCNFHNARESGLTAILEIVGGGVGCIDFDRDGWTDLIFPRGGKIDLETKQVTGLSSKVIRNIGNWEYRDCSNAAGFVFDGVYAHGIASSDFDQDGFCDVLIYGFGGVILVRNQGDGTFSDVTDSVGLKQSKWTTAAAWGDFNNDRNLDLYLGSYVDWDLARNQVCKARNDQPDVCSPNAYEGVQNSVAINHGDGSFSISSELLKTTQPAKTLGALAAEFEPGNGIAVYAANDLVANFLFTKKNGQYLEHGFASGVAVDDSGVANGSMGVALLDFNLDCNFDLFVTNFEHELMGLYLNAEDDFFNHASRKVGLNRTDLNSVAFGVVATDFDGDGDEDIIYTCGHVHYFPDVGPMEQLPIYLQNEAGQRLSKITPNCKYFSDPTVGRGLATADLDQDGDLDLIGTSLFGPPSIVENTFATADWLKIELVGVHCARTPIGATAELTIGKTKMVRQLHGGGSFLSQSEQLLHFAWPREASDSQSALVGSLVIRWPDGTTSKPITVESNKQLIVVQSQNR